MAGSQPIFTSIFKIQPICCPSCGEKASIIRRALDASKDDGSEIWAFQCENGHVTEVPDRR